eukprot:2846973-Rhodomonas_salina.1
MPRCWSCLLLLAHSRRLDSRHPVAHVASRGPRTCRFQEPAMTHALAVSAPRTQPFAGQQNATGTGHVCRGDCWAQKPAVEVRGRSHATMRKSASCCRPSSHPHA